MVFLCALFNVPSISSSGGPPPDLLWCEKYPNDSTCRGGDPLPMLLAFPKLFDYQGGLSLLGLGDIVLPGLLLSFGARLDSAKRLLGIRGGGNGNLISHGCPEKRFCSNCLWCSGGYFAPLVVAYAVGLLAANLAVNLMKMGQPALLYLVPSCLGTMTYLGFRRHELGDLWDDPKVIRAADREVYGDEEEEEQDEEDVILTTPSSRHARLPQEEGDDSDAPTVPSAIDDGTY